MRPRNSPLAAICGFSRRCVSAMVALPPDSGGSRRFEKTAQIARSAGKSESSLGDAAQGIDEKRRFLRADSRRQRLGGIARLDRHLAARQHRAVIVLVVDDMDADAAQPLAGG